MTRRALLWTHDLLGARTGVVSRDFLELYTDDTFGGTQELRFTIAADHPKRYLLILDTDIIYGGRRYFIDEITEDRTGARIEVRVKAPAAWYRLGQFDNLGSLTVDNKTPYEGLEDILAATEWAPGAVIETTDEFSLEQESRSILDIVHTWAAITGTYATFDTAAKTVSLSTTTGATRGIAFRTGRNLRNLQRRNTAPEVTELVPYGALGITIEAVNSDSGAIEDYSFYTNLGLTIPEARARFRKRKVWNNSAALTPRDLLAAARARLARLAQSVQQVELDVIDISSLTGIAEPLDVGDNVTAFDPDLDEEFVAFVTRLRRYPLEPHRNTVELSASPDVLADPNAAGPSGDSQQWLQLIGPIEATSIRDDTEASAAAISVRFVPGAQANFHLDLWATGVGDGTMHVRIVDTEADEAHYRTLDIPYTDGNTVRATIEWATSNIEAALYTFEVLVSTTADGGPSPTAGVDVIADITNRLEAGWWIMAKGATKIAPNLPKTPVSLTFVATCTDAALPQPYGLVNEGIYCYVTNNSGGVFAVVDISDPTAPLVIGSVTAVSPAYLSTSRQLAKDGDYCYVPAHQYLTIINVANPAAPVIVGTLNDSTRFFSAECVIKEGNYAYVANCRGSGVNDYLSVVDVSNPALPTLAGSVLFGVDVAPGAIGMVKEGSLIYVAAEVNGATGGLFVVDVSNPASPSVVGTLNVAALNGAGGVVKDGDYCYVSAGTTNDTVVIDVSDIGAMSVVASIDTGGATGGPIDKRFDFVYRSAPSSSYFSIIDWTELTAPTIAATLSHAGLSNSTMFALAGDYIYVAAVGTPGVTVLEIGYDED